MTEPNGGGVPDERDVELGTAPDVGPDVDQSVEPELERGAGDPRVAAAVERLDELADLPPAEHVEVYESVHRVLQESLAEAQADRADG